MKKSPKIITSFLALSVLFVSAWTVIYQVNDVQTHAIGTLTSTLPSTIVTTPTSESTIRNYYQSLDGLSTSERKGNNLLKNLKPILSSGMKYYSYANAWKVFMITDRDWDLSPLSPLTGYAYNDNPNVRLLYRNDNGTATAAHFNDTHRTYIDREHCWPQSRGFGADTATGPAGTDVHHLILGDSVNNQTGHNNYAWGDEDHGIAPTSIGTAERHNNTGIRWSATDKYGGDESIYEPQDSDKGNIARAIFYMAARYNNWAGTSGAISDYEPFLQVTDEIYDSSEGTIHSSDSTPVTMGILSTLLKWHESDPVDSYEILRNNLIYNNFQINRNPFIDFPEWVDAAYGNTGFYATPSSDTINGYNEEEVLVTSITLSPSSLTLSVGGSSGTLTPTISPVDASNKTVTWTSSNNSIATVANGVVNPVAVGTTAIRATAADGSGVYGQASVTVQESSARTLDYIEVSGYDSSVPFKSTYDYYGIMVTAHYDDLSTADVTSSSTIGTVDTTVLGEQIIDVSYSTEATHFLVKVTNNGTVFESEPVTGEPYASETAYLGDISGWSEYGTDTYADGSVKLDGSGDYVYKTDIWSGQNSLNLTSILVMIPIKQNGGTSQTTPNVMTVSAINGDISTVIGNATQTGGFGTTKENETFVISLASPSTVTGLKITYTTKDTGNLGVYSINATPTYTGETLVTPQEQAVAYAWFFLQETAPYCTALNGGESPWDYLSEEYGYMADDTKDYFVNEETTDEAISLALERYSYLINKYSSLSSAPFIEDSLGNDYGTNPLITKTTVNTKNNDYSFIFITLISILSLSAFIFYKNRVHSV